jgi:hypothetical protein
MNARTGILFLSLVAATGLAQSTNLENLAKNPGFEAADATAVLPEDWVYFSSKGMNCTLAADTKRSGDRCVKFRAQGTRYAHAGLAQTVPVEPGRKYTFTAFVRNNEKELLGRSAWGMLGIEWKDAGQKELGRIESAHWTRTLSRMRWEVFEVSGKAPAGAVSAAFVMHLDDGDPAGEGSFFVDDVLITVK